ncbi:MAG: bifunctional precorrin-2 dehydrogenase/sirohydrochlorin ferrochelatase [Coriobacteriia bacterium]|nr:bifunctional precorrin-2 dehydrogenase/sirohydrochlorin ferrochelatase [Coriobacteriia bacterium]
MPEDYAKSYYPVFVDLEGRLAVVVGGGAVAERKVLSLLQYGAEVRVIAPVVTSKIETLAAEGRVTLQRRGYVRGDVGGAFLVVCATDSAEVNRAVNAEADACGCLVNVVDVPELCNFIVPSVVQRGPLQIAVSTAGAAPAVAKRLRKQLEEEFGPEWETYTRLLGEVRSLVMERVAGGETVRKPIFEAIADSDLIVRIESGERPSAEDVFAEFAETEG